MKNTRFSITLLFIFFAGVVFAQKDVEINYKTLSQLPAVTKVEIKKLKNADEIYFQETFDNYKTSLPLYLAVANEKLDYYPLNWRIAMCYLHSENKPLAIDFLLRCADSGNKLYDFYLGKAYQFDGQFEKAKESYHAFIQGFQEEDGKQFFANFDARSKNFDFAVVMQQLIDACDLAINTTSDSIAVVFENIEVINSSRDELYPSLHPDGTLVYSSNKLVIPGAQNANFTIYDAVCDSMLAIRFPKQSSKYPVDVGDNLIASPYSEKATDILYQSMKSNGGDVMVVRTEDGVLGWQAIPKINAYSKEGLACFLNDTTLVFSSDRASKDGSSDLYITYKTIKGKWGKPMPIAGGINTEGNEEAVAYVAGELYFTTNATGGIGGYDIYKVPYLGANTWGAVENLGYPINTADNDMGYFPVNDSSALYCGVRSGGLGGVDIYKVTYSTSDSVDVVNLDSLVVRQPDSLSGLADSLLISKNDTMAFVPLLDTLFTDSVPVITLENIEEQLDSIVESADSLLIDTIIEDVETSDSNKE